MRGNGTVGYVNKKGTTRLALTGSPDINLHKNLQGKFQQNMKKINALNSYFKNGVSLLHVHDQP